MVRTDKKENRQRKTAFPPQKAALWSRSKPSHYKFYLLASPYQNTLKKTLFCVSYLATIAFFYISVNRFFISFMNFFQFLFYLYFYPCQFYPIISAQFLWKNLHYRLNQQMDILSFIREMCG